MATEFSAGRQRDRLPRRDARSGRGRAALHRGAAAPPGSRCRTTAITPDLPVPTAIRDDHAVRLARLRRAPGRACEPTFNLACLNGDHLAELVRARGDEILEGRPTIGQWGWETDVLPPSWTAAFGLVDEVWVYSRFMAENLGRLLPMPVVVVPPAIVAPDPAGAELPVADDDRFTFVFMLDFFSTLRRKNALGLVDAFTRAFAPDEGPRLILKTINARFRPEAADELRFRAGDRADIEFFDEYLDPAQKARAAGARRLLRLAAPQRGVRAAARRVDGARNAGDRHRLLGQHRLHHPSQQLPRRLEADARRPRLRDLPARGQLGRTRPRPRRRAHAPRLASTPRRQRRRGARAQRRHRDRITPRP